jgi:hypothetical protein
MPRKQRFKPTRKPKLTIDGPIERTEETPAHSTSEDQAMQRSAQPDDERRSE